MILVTINTILVAINTINTINMTKMIINMVITPTQQHHIQKQQQNMIQTMIKIVKLININHIHQILIITKQHLIKMEIISKIMVYHMIS